MRVDAKVRTWSIIAGLKSLAMRRAEGAIEEPWVENRVLIAEPGPHPTSRMAVAVVKGDRVLSEVSMLLMGVIIGPFSIERAYSAAWLFQSEPLVLKAWVMVL